MVKLTLNQQANLIQEVIRKTKRNAPKGNTKMKSTVDRIRSKSSLCDVILPGIDPF